MQKKNPNEPQQQLDWGERAVVRTRTRCGSCCSRRKKSWLGLLMHPLVASALTQLVKRYCRAKGGKT